MSFGSVRLFCATLIATLAAGTAAAAPGEVAILSTTAWGGSITSPEAAHVTSLGMTPVLISPADWGSMSTADFASYEGVFLADPHCSTDLSLVQAATDNAGTWAAAVGGNVVVIGSDPVYHAASTPGAQALIEKSVEFALDEAYTGETGAYLSLSCYYHFAVAGTHVPALGGFGDFSVIGGSYTSLNDVRIVASHPAIDGLTNGDLSNWGNSVHEAFTQWPGSFEVLALAADGTGPYTAADGTVGYPYILARGVIPDFCGDGTVDPGEECDDGNNDNGDGCDEACNVETGCADADQDGVCDDDDVCPGYDDLADDDLDGVPDGCDLCPGFDDLADSDFDGVPDGCDVEECDGLDNDGDGLIDEGFDLDGDGYTTCNGDCDDSNDTVYPGAEELCDGLDNDCSGTPDAGESDLDGDGVMTCAGDNCDDVYNPDQWDSDGDGAGDVCDICPFDPEDDADEDGVCGDVDLCPDTGFSDQDDGVPSRRLGNNRWAEMDGDGIFDQGEPGHGPLSGGDVTIEMTGGCNCSQIIDALGLGNGHVKFGCSNSAMEDWLAQMPW